MIACRQCRKRTITRDYGRLPESGSSEMSVLQEQTRNLLRGVMVFPCFCVILTASWVEGRVLLMVMPAWWEQRLLEENCEDPEVQSLQENLTILISRDVASCLQPSLGSKVCRSWNCASYTSILIVSVSFHRLRSVNQRRSC